jgi:HAD superfamily hydrolase (TIGR01509 family)
LLRGLFFDFDGLIMDTETPEVKSWTQMYAQYGLDYPAEYWQFVVGRGPDQLPESTAERLVRLAGLEEPAETIFARFREAYFQILVREPLPGVIQLLSLAQEKGLRQFVVSSSDEAWVRGHVEGLGLAGFFEDLITRERAARSKPAPDLYLKALEVTGLEPAEVHVFEDSFNGMTAAIEAGLKVTVCPNPTTMHQDFSRATRVVQSLEEELERVAGIEPA